MSTPTGGTAYVGCQLGDTRISSTGRNSKVPHPDIRIVGSDNCFVNRDHLGSIRTETDATKTVQLRLRYASFGLRTQDYQGTGCTIEDRAFIGERYATNSDLIDLNACWYNPNTALFLTPDWLDPVDGDTARAGKPVGWRDNPVGTNLYAYAGQDPINKGDPGGHQAFADVRVYNNLGVSEQASYAQAQAGRVAAERVLAGIDDAKRAANQIQRAVVPGAEQMARAIESYKAGKLNDAGLWVAGSLVFAIVETALPEGKAAQGTAYVWRSSRTSASKLEHIFSADHVKNGIMDLGKSRDMILEQARDALMTADKRGALREGSNTVVTKMNGLDATVRGFIKDGEMQSINIFRGVSEREGLNVIDLR